MNFFKLFCAKPFAHLRSVLVETDNIFNYSNNIWGKILTSSKTLFISSKRNIFTPRLALNTQKYNELSSTEHVFDRKNGNCKNSFLQLHR